MILASDKLQPRSDAGLTSAIYNARPTYIGRPSLLRVIHCSNLLEKSVTLPSLEYMLVQ